MNPLFSFTPLAAAAAAALGLLSNPAGTAGKDFDPLLSLPGGQCTPAASGPPPLIKQWMLAQAKTEPKGETAPFSATTARASAQPASGAAAVPLYGGLGKVALRISTTHHRAQAYFDQGLRLAFGFNHAEAQRAFQAAQKLDPLCAMCFWGEAWVLGPNINMPMAPEALTPALAAMKQAQALAAKASARDRELIDALARRYSEDPKAERPALDAAFADAMKAVAARHRADDTIQAIYAEAVMDTQPWDYWEAAGTRPKARAQEMLTALETVLARNPSHAGASHLYIHAVEASAKPERALPHARRLAALMPGAGHIVHMPAHIYYRVGLYRESLEVNRRAIAVDERYFKTSSSDPIYRFAYHTHNIHFVLVSAQMGGDAKTALQAAEQLDRSLPADVVKAFAVLEPLKAAPYFAHALFSDATTLLALPAPPSGSVLVGAMYHYTRALAFAAKADLAAAKAEVAHIARIEQSADFKPFTDWGVPAKEIVQTARWVATGRIADAAGDLDAAAKAYEEAVLVEDSLAYMEPPFWYYPVRQSLASVRLRQGRLDEAEKAFRDSLARVRNNGWAIAGLVETYRRSGNTSSEKAARTALARTWFGGKPPDLARL